MAQRRHEHHVGVARIHQDLAYLVGVLQADVSPGLARVRGLVHALAVGDVGAHVGLAGAHIDHFGSEGATARAPMEPTGTVSKIGCQVRPVSLVSHTPPSTAPK